MGFPFNYKMPEFHSESLDEALRIHDHEVLGVLLQDCDVEADLILNHRHLDDEQALDDRLVTSSVVGF